MQIYELGDSILIEATTYTCEPFEEPPEEPSQTTTELHIYYDDELIEENVMDEYEPGEYYYLWHTQDLERGNYILKIISTNNDDKRIKTERIFLERKGLGE